MGDVENIVDAVPGLADFREAIAKATSEFWLIRKTDTVLIAQFVDALLAHDAAATACLEASKPAGFYDTVNSFMRGK